MQPQLLILRLLDIKSDAAHRTGLSARLGRETLITAVDPDLHLADGAAHSKLGRGERGLTTSTELLNTRESLHFSSKKVRAAQLERGAGGNLFEPGRLDLAQYVDRHPAADGPIVFAVHAAFELFLAQLQLDFLGQLGALAQQQFDGGYKTRFEGHQLVHAGRQIAETESARFVRLYLVHAERSHFVGVDPNSGNGLRLAQHPSFKTGLLVCGHRCRGLPWLRGGLCRGLCRDRLRFGRRRVLGEQGRRQQEGRCEGAPDETEPQPAQGTLWSAGALRASFAAPRIFGAHRVVLSSSARCHQGVPASMKCTP